MQHLDLILPEGNLYRFEFVGDMVEKMSSFDTFNFFLGSWSLVRRIYDRKTSSHTSFTGLAMVRETSDGFSLYEEEGKLVRDNFTGRANRSLRISRNHDGSVEMHFPDLRFFQKVDLKNGSWSGKHLCGSDSYEIEISIQSDSAMIEKWNVQGPNKSYEALTQLHRI